MSLESYEGAIRSSKDGLAIIYCHIWLNGVTIVGDLKGRCEQLCSDVFPSKRVQSQ